MPTTGIADRDGHALESVAAAEKLDLPPRRWALLMDKQSDEGLIARFLLGYRDRTRAAYQADLRDFRAWCARAGIGLLGVHRTHIEAYMRQLEQARRSRATVARRLATLTGCGPGGSAPPLPRRPCSSPLGGARFPDAWA